MDRHLRGGIINAGIFDSVATITNIGYIAPGPGDAENIVHMASTVRRWIIDVRLDRLDYGAYKKIEVAAKRIKRKVRR